MIQIEQTLKNLREGLFPKLLGKIIFGILRAAEEGERTIVSCDEAGIILPNVA